MLQSGLDKFHIINPYLQNESSLSVIARKNNLNLRTLQRWVSQYKKIGLDGLNKKIRSDLGIHRKVSLEIKEAIEGLALQKDNITMATITRTIADYCSEQNILPISYDIIRKIIKAIPSDLNTLARYGDKYYEDLYEIIMRRKSKYPNEIWQADHSMLDIKALLDNGEEDCPWLTIIIDDFSRAIMGFFLFIGAPSAIQTALALRNAIWYKQDKDWPLCGIPENLYTDHGTDFTSDHIKYVCADLKINLIHSIVAKPKGRGKVERFFLSLEQKLLSQLRFKNKVYKMKELNKLIHDFIVYDYNNSIHSVTKETPLNLWRKDQIIPQMPESIEKLNLLLLTTKKSRIVQRDGISFNGLRYFHPNLAAYVGEDVTIRFDPTDLAEIWVYDNENKCVCKAICDELQEQSISYEELRKIRTTRKKQLKQEIKSKINRAEQLLKYKETQKQVSDSEPRLIPQKNTKYKLYQNE